MHLDILMKCAHAVSRLKIVSRCDGMHHFKSRFALLVLGNLKRVEPITSSHGLPKRHDVELGVDQVHPSRACTHPGKCPQSDQWKFFKATLTQALLAFMQMLRGCIMRRTRPKPLLSPPDAFKQRIYVIILIYAKTCPNQAGCEDCHVQSIRSIPVCKLHLLILFRRQWLTYHCAGPRILCCAAKVRIVHVNFADGCCEVEQARSSSTALEFGVPWWYHCCRAWKVSFLCGLTRSSQT